VAWQLADTQSRAGRQAFLLFLFIVSFSLINMTYHPVAGFESSFSYRLSFISFVRVSRSSVQLPGLDRPAVGRDVLGYRLGGWDGMRVELDGVLAEYYVY